MKKPQTLTARFVQTVRIPGRYGDGRGGYGLALNVHQAGNGRITRSWVQRIRVGGRLTNIGLGSYPIISLSEARTMAIENMRNVKKGLDPRGGIPVFSDALESTIAIHIDGWKDGGKTAKQWRASMNNYVLPKIGKKRVDKIATADILDILTPYWHEKPETMRRVKRRISAVMKWAVAQGYRDSNPAGEALTQVLPKADKVAAHFKALPYHEVSAAIEVIRQSEAYPVTKLLFEYIVLTAVRSGEGRRATWDEVNLDARTWTIPADRTKSGREHRVPLSDAALSVLEQAREHADGSGWVFPSVTGKALSDSTLSKALRDNGVKAVPHGFRSSFRSWTAERTNAPREVCELALAHVTGDQVERAYQRSDLFEARRRLMDQWASYLSSSKATVRKIA